MKHITLLVTGAGGMVGSYATSVFGDSNLTLTDVIDGYFYLSVEDSISVEKLIDDIRPDFVLHLAAATDVDKCEIEQEWAFRVNREGTRNVALACKKSNSTMIYVSTGAVFNGEKKNPYIEIDPASSLNKYGISKYEGEMVIKSLLEKYYIVRASWMIGGGKNDKKFVGKIMQKIMSGEKSIKVVNDKFGSITYARDLLYRIKELIKTDRFGTYHMTNEGMHSRYDIAKEIVNILGKADVRIIPVSSDEFPLPAPRSRSEALENRNLKLMNLNLMQPWKDALKEYIKDELLPLYQPET
ncbi:dTDP-4-dehydrorhamnose reductase [Candidatus Omnitrophota bacterium]